MIDGALLVGIDMAVALGGEHQRLHRAFGAQIHRRGLQTEPRFALMGLLHPLLVLVPQHRPHRRAAADDQRILAELAHQLARGFVGQQHADRATQRRGRQQLPMPSAPPIAPAF